MKISVIVPVYNVEPYLEKCISSILLQDFEDYEIIIVNDGTEDKSGEIIKEFVDTYPEKIVYIEQENKGLGAARNTGIHYAQGEYLLFVDSDDYISPDTLRTVYEKIIEEQADLLLFDFYFVSETYEIMERNFACLGNKSGFRLETYPELLFDNPSTWNKLYHRSLFLNYDIVFPDRMWYEDLRTSAKIYTKAKKIVYLKEPLYYYYQRKDSIMHTKEVAQYLQIIGAVEDVFEYFQKQELYEQYRNELEFLAVYQVLFFATIHVNKINAESKVQNRLKEYTIKKFPNYQKNLYYKKRFTIKEKVILFFIRKGWYRLLRNCFDISKKRKGLQE